ncbi:hypothetical protein SSX86_002344 [Deinandra increscens subsp. villosa]|uniref:Pleiotropic ABC efflux transporter N-terminal domain-containing protein n=1 Tax=Deinandra increscens subsp. villosa TaxID=3103831 RepID=A0AAP0DT95_9ASTR
MDESDMYKASSSLSASSGKITSLRASSGKITSLRVASSSIWRSSGMDAFSKSSREENDEEALKWAAIEKLPTFDRLKKGLLFGSTGPSNEINVKNLGMEERKKLLDRLVKAPEEDNEKFLLRLRKRIDRVGIDLPTIEVKFEHLNVEADIETGSRALPSFFNFYLEIVEGFLSLFHLLPNRKKHITILDDVSGILKPGRMTLLLGPPSSGKTTLLLALTGNLSENLQVQQPSISEVLAPNCVYTVENGESGGVSEVRHADDDPGLLKSDNIANIQTPTVSRKRLLMKTSWIIKWKLRLQLLLTKLTVSRSFSGEDDSTMENDGESSAVKEGVDMPTYSDMIAGKSEIESQDCSREGA